MISFNQIIFFIFCSFLFFGNFSGVAKKFLRNFLIFKEEFFNVKNKLFLTFCGVLVFFMDRFESYYPLLYVLYINLWHLF